MDIPRPDRIVWGVVKVQVHPEEEYMMVVQPCSGVFTKLL